MSKRVLVAEDDQAISDVVKIILESEGYDVAVADVRDVIYQRIQEAPPDLILLDIWLSGYDGGEIAKELKSNDRTKTVPVVMVSANNETEKIAKEAGADSFLLKPFNIDDLLKTVKTYIKE